MKPVIKAEKYVSPLDFSSANGDASLFYRKRAAKSSVRPNFAEKTRKKKRDRRFRDARASFVSLASTVKIGRRFAVNPFDLSLGGLRRLC